jgi:hypothetical protein
MIQWRPLSVSALGLVDTDNINRKITITVTVITTSET